MKRLYKGIEIVTENVPELDPGFIPIEAFFRAFEKQAGQRMEIAIVGNEDVTTTYETRIHGTAEMRDVDCYYAEKLIKFLLWSRGGYRIAIAGAPEIAEHIREVFSAKGSRSFDYFFMNRVYEKTPEVLSLPFDAMPQKKVLSHHIGRNLSGCRIGFDAGGSDRKVSAVIDGESVYSEEVVWFPKTEEDPQYHYEEIVNAFKTAASKMPRVDAIGVSSAGVYIGNETKVASLFLKVPPDKFQTRVKDIYIRAAKEIGDVPLVVANDGDVTALAGSMSLGVNNIMGIAMGTSQAVGYVDENGSITGWLNELAFAPVDLSDSAPQDEWSGDFGVGCKYFSQDAVIRLALLAGIKIDESLTLAEKLKEIQGLSESGDAKALAIFRDIGKYLAHSIPFYYRFYKMDHILLMGRVTSRVGGSIMVEEAKRVLKEQYPDLMEKINLILPDEKSRRVGQSIAAASLPEIEVK